MHRAVLLLDGGGRHVRPAALPDSEGNAITEVSLIVADRGVGGGVTRNRASHQISGGSVGICGGIGGLMPYQSEGQQRYDA